MDENESFILSQLKIKRKRNLTVLQQEYKRCQRAKEAVMTYLERGKPINILDEGVYHMVMEE